MRMLGRICMVGMGGGVFSEEGRGRMVEKRVALASTSPLSDVMLSSGPRRGKGKQYERIRMN